MDAWLFLLVAAAITVAPGVVLTLLCRNEAHKGGESLLPRWRAASSITHVAVGGATAVSLLSGMLDQAKAEQPESALHVDDEPRRH